MRVTALTIALLLSGTAIAQTTTTTEPTTGTHSGTHSTTDVSTQTDDTADVSTDTTGTTDTGTMSTTTGTGTGTMSSSSGTMSSGTMSSSTGAMSSGTMSSSTGMQTAMAPASGQVVQPGNQNPEEDARGISVMSAAAVVPPGWNGIPGTGTGGPLIDPTTGQSAAETTYPACSRTVTDNCVQAYERGRS
jgi:hypothetical protein